MFDFSITVLGICFLFNYILKSPGYHGPRTDHFDGKHFHNIAPHGERFNARENSITEFFIFLYKRFDSIRWKHRPLVNTEVVPQKKVEGGEIVVTFINHSTVLIQTEGVNIITDPIWALRASPFPFLGPKRFVDPGVRIFDLPKIDILLLTHNHYDHMDINALRSIAERDHPAIYTTLGNTRYLRNKGIYGAQDMDWGDTRKFSDDIRIDCVPAQHFSARAITDRKNTLWGGFVIRTPHGDIYFAGDSGYGPCFSRIAKIYPNGFRLGFIPIGAFEPRSFMQEVHIGPVEAVQVYKELKVQKAVAIHFGTFDLALDAQDDPPQKLKEILSDPANSSVDFIALSNGEQLVVK